MGIILWVLLVEDSEDDELLLQRALIRDGHTPFIRRVDSSDAMHAALCDETWDLVLADWNLPRFSALIALEMIKRTGLDLPFIIVSGMIGEEAAITAMKAGAHDFVMKSNLVRLVPAIQRRASGSRRAQSQAPCGSGAPRR